MIRLIDIRFTTDSYFIDGFRFSGERVVTDESARARSNSVTFVCLRGGKVIGSETRENATGTGACMVADEPRKLMS